MLDKNVKHIINAFNQVLFTTAIFIELSATTIPLSLLLKNQDKLSYTLLPEIGIN